MYVRVVAKLSKTLASRELKKQLKELDNLNVNVGINVKNRKDTKAKIKQNIDSLQKTVSDLEIGLKATKAESDVAGIQRRVQKKASKTPISLNLEVKKDKAIADIEYIGKKYSRLFSNISASKKYENILNSAYSISDSKDLSSVRAQISAFTSELKNSGLAAQSTGDKMRNLIDRYKDLFSVVSIVRTVFSQVKQAVSTTIDLDKTYTDLVKVNEELTRNDYASYLSQCNQKAKELATTQKGLIEGAAEFSKSGYDLATSDALTEKSTILANVGDMSASDSAKAIISGVQAFDVVDGYTDAVDKAQALIDKYNAIGNTASINSAEIAQGVQKVGSVFADANTSVDEFISLLSAGNRQYQDADALSLGLRTAALRIRGCSAELEAMGEESEGVYTSASKLEEKIKGLTNVNGTGGVSILEADGETFRSIYDIFMDISKVYKDMSDTDAAALLELIAGKNRASAISATLNNMTEAEDILQNSLHAAGSAQKEYDTYLGSTEAHIQKFQTTLVETYSTFMNGDMISHAADLGTSILNLVNGTDLLKHGILAILALNIGKGITTIGGVIAGTITQMNTLGSALQQVKNLPVDESRTKPLVAIGKATQNLTEKNLKLLLSQKNLSEQDRLLILQQHNLTDEEAKAKLEKLNLTAATNTQTAANKANAASTFTLSGAMSACKASAMGMWTSFKAMVMSNPIGFALTAATTAFSVFSTISSKAKQKAEEARSKNIELAESASENAKNLSELYTQYQKLNAIQNRTSSQEEEYKTVIENITKVLGDKANALEGLTAGTERYADALKRATQEELKEQYAKAVSGRKAAEEDIQDDAYSSWSGSKVTVRSNSQGMALSDDAQQAVDTVKDILKDYEGINQTWKNIEWGINSNDPEEITDYYYALQKAKEALALASDKNEALLDTEIYKGIEQTLATVSESMDTYIERKYEELKLDYLWQNGVPETEEEYQKMEESILKASSAGKYFQEVLKTRLATDFPSVTEEVKDTEKALSDASKATTSETTSSPISIDEAWLALANPDKEELKNTQKDLSELAKAGRLTEETFHETTGADIFLDKIGISAKEAIQWINQLQTATDQLASMKNGISSITDVLGKKQEGETIGADTLAGFDSTFKQLEYWEEFESIMGDSTSTMEQCQSAANKLATAWVNNSNFLANLTEKNQDAYESMLTQMGVANANEIVTSALAEKTNLLALEEQFAKDTGKSLTDATYEEINSFLQAQNASDSLKTAFYQLALQKELTNGVTLDFSSDIERINELVSKIGGATRSLQILQQIKNGKANYIPTSEYEKIVQGAQQEVDNALNTKKKKTKVKVNPTPTSSSGSGGSNSKSSKTSNNTVIDWISRKLDRLNSKISLTQARYENLVDTLGKNRGKKKKKLPKNSDGLLTAQIENLDEQIKLYDKLAKNEKKAVQRYDKKASNVNLSGSLKKAIRDGKIGTKKTKMKELITTYGEKKAKKIQEYEQWYDAARNAEKDYESARSSSRQKTEEKYQIQADAAQAKINVLQSQAAHATDDYATQNKYLKEQSKWIAKNYDMQIAIANLNKDTVLAADLQAQKAEELAQLEKQKFDNIQADFENRRSTYQMQMDVIEARNSLLEAKGQKIQTSSYKNEIKQEQETLKTYKDEKAELEKQIKTIPKGTDEWYRAKEAINKCDVEIINCTASTAELNNKITELADNAKTALQTAFATMASEGDLFAELMSNKDLFDTDTGIITKEGLATLGTYGNGYNVSKTSAEMDQKLLDKLNAGLNHDFNKGAFRFIDDNGEERVYNSLDQLEDAIKEVYEDWREQIQNTFQYESKIIDMMRDKLENELSALKELIEQKKSALAAEKELQQYRKSIKESTSNIASLSKQITAVQGDTSEAGIARIQKLQNDLKQQEENLAEQEFDHLIQAEQDMLDNLYNEYSDLITNEMQDTRRLLDKGFQMIESSTGTINQTIKDYSGRYGYTPEYDNHMNSGSGDITNDAKGEDSNSGVPNLANVTGSSLRGINSGKTATPPQPKEQKSEVVKGTLFTKDELKKIKPKVEKIFDNKKLYKKGTSDGTTINDFLYKKNGKVLTSKALKKLRKICGTNDNDVMFEVLQSISKTIGQIKNVKGFKEGGIAKVVKSKGEDGLIMARNGEGFVKPEHVGEVKKLFDVLPQLNAAMSYQIETPKMPEIKPVQVSPNQVVEIGNVTLPNVTNYEEFREQMFKDMQKDTKFEKMMQSMTISKIAQPQHSRFSKNSIRF